MDGRPSRVPPLLRELSSYSYLEQVTFPSTCYQTNPVKFKAYVSPCSYVRNGSQSARLSPKGPVINKISWTHSDTGQSKGKYGQEFQKLRFPHSGTVRSEMEKAQRLSPANGLGNVQLALGEVSQSETREYMN